MYIAWSTARQHSSKMPNTRAEKTTAFNTITTNNIPTTHAKNNEYMLLIDSVGAFREVKTFVNTLKRNTITNTANPNRASTIPPSSRGRAGGTARIPPGHWRRTEWGCPEKLPVESDRLRRLEEDKYFVQKP